MTDSNIRRDVCICSRRLHCRAATSPWVQEDGDFGPACTAISRLRAALFRGSDGMLHHLLLTDSLMSSQKQYAHLPPFAFTLLWELISTMCQSPKWWLNLLCPVRSSTCISSMCTAISACTAMPAVEISCFLPVPSLTAIWVIVSITNSIMMIVMFWGGKIMIAIIMIVAAITAHLAVTCFMSFLMMGLGEEKRTVSLSSDYTHS